MYAPSRQSSKPPAPTDVDPSAPPGAQARLERHSLVFFVRPANDVPLRALADATERGDRGFFLMIEASRIDHAGHLNDPAAQVREVLEYDKTFKTVVDFLEDSNTEGLLVATSDHETGGLSTAWRRSLADNMNLAYQDEAY